MKKRVIVFFASLLYLQLSAIVNGDIQKLGTFAKKNSWAFEENKGQVLGSDSAKVKFRYKPNASQTVFVTNHSLIYQFEKWDFPVVSDSMKRILRTLENIEAVEQYMKDTRIETYRMDMELIGANPNPQMILEDKSSDYINYYNHNALDVHSYQKIIFKNIYPNIDWVIYSVNNEQSIVNNDITTEGTYSKFKTNNSKFIKYDFIIHPGGNPNLIQWKTKWVEDLKLDHEGNLVMKNMLGTIIENRPISFQGDKRILSSFHLAGDKVSFHLASHDTTKDLIIDPSIGWVTYYGGYVPINSVLGSSSFYSTVIDGLGNVYACGTSNEFANIASGGYQNSNASLLDAILVKFDNNGYRLWATYYGGEGVDWAEPCVVDQLNNVYIAGSTSSNSGIAYNGFQNSLIGFTGSFIVKFNSLGNRGWATYFGNTSTNIRSMCYDPNNNIYVVGDKSSVAINEHNLSFNGHQSSYGGGSYDAFIAKFSVSGSRLWASYYGDIGYDRGYSCAADANGSVFLAGVTSSINNISYNGHQNNIGGLGYMAPLYPSNGESFLVKFDKDGVRRWATYYGDTNFLDRTYSCAVDKDNNVYISGVTESNRFIATAGTHCNFNNNTVKYFLAKFNNSGTRLWGTYYGDNLSYYDFGGSSYYHSVCAVDDSNFVYIMGRAVDSSQGNMVQNGFQSIHSGIYPDLVIVKFNSLGSRIWGSYFGGKGEEWFSRDKALTIDKKGNLFFVGLTDSLFSSLYVSRNLAYKGFQSAYSETFLGKICNRLDSPSITISANRGNPICEGSGLNFTTVVGNEGSFPVYEWRVNRQALGTNRSSIYLTNLKNNDTVECLLRSSATCLYFDTILSNKYVVKVKSADTTHFYDTICSNQSYYFNNQNVTATGIYRDTFVSSLGCDSFLFLHLYVKNTSFYNFSHTTPCSNNPSYTFNGQARTQSGTYTATYLNALGCDSTVTLTLTLKKHTSAVLTPISLCPGSSYTFDGIPRTTSGTYTRIISNSQGCDSTESLTIQVLNNPKRDTTTLQGCTPFTWNGKTYMSSTSFIDTLQSKQNCDSAYKSYIIQLKPLAKKLANQNYLVCDSVRIKGILHTTSFNYVDTIKTQDNLRCDSLYQPISYEIKYKPKLTLSTKQIDTFFKGEIVVLTPSYAKNYLWNTGESTRTLSFKLTEDKSVYVIAWNETECRDTAYLDIIALDPTILEFPTGFSPQGQYAENRVFRPNIKGKIESIQLDVFNRLGEKVYSWNQLWNIGWDGTYKGLNCPSGIYTYLIEYTSNRIRFFKSGEVMLVR